MRDIFILNEIWAQNKIGILVRTLLGSNILLTLVNTGTESEKKHNYASCFVWV
jgi:hypothetical protein